MEDKNQVAASGSSTFVSDAESIKAASKKKEVKPVVEAAAVNSPELTEVEASDSAKESK